jgi:hypothetical protein
LIVMMLSVFIEVQEGGKTVGNPVTGRLKAIF